MKVLFFILMGVSFLNGSPASDDQAVILNAKKLVDALNFVGAPLSVKNKNEVLNAEKTDDIEKVLDPLSIVSITINPESRVKVNGLMKTPSLIEKGWSSYLVKVINQAGVTAPLEVSSPQSQPLANSPAKLVNDRWLDIDVFRKKPLNPTLSGVSLEYRIINLYSRDVGRRSAILQFNVGQGTQDLGFRSELLQNFQCVPTSNVVFRVFDENGKPTTAGFEIRDNLGRVYPLMSKRLAPDMHFHPQVYRNSGETVKLPRGSYSIKYSRGPEYFSGVKKFNFDGGNNEIEFHLSRWIDPSRSGWWSGDHHIHAAGCSHYSKPTEGVHAPDMMRQCLGEDLKVGSNLTWGPCFDYQKQFFTGKDDKVSRYPYLLRYDIEVSGFGSHQSGHLCLLRLKNQMFPGGDSTEHWPTLCLNTLKWAKSQGAVVGPAHSGWGLNVDSIELPNYIIPPFDGIGACEYIVDVTHKVPGPSGKMVPAVDFISTVDTPITWELNIWYHTLNVGYRTRISGETDYPCIYGERVGLGRSYVKLDGNLTYNKWCQGIRLGRNYTGDGRSHLMDFSVNGVEVGTHNSEVQIKEKEKVKVKARVAAFLTEDPLPGGIKDRPLDQQPYWHLERARVGTTRNVKVELVVNGYPVEEKIILADGKINEVEFDYEIKMSSWLALRIYKSSHSNPIWAIVDKKPVRASKRSAEWCLKSVEQCWKQKERFIAKNELVDAIKAYDHARRAYQKIIKESSFD